MTKFNLKNLLILSALIISFASCSKGKVTIAETVAAEVLPEDIVELRADQIKLANVELGAVEMHSLSNVLKVNGIVSVAPQNYATVCMPLGGFIKTTSQLPGELCYQGPDACSD